MKSEFKRRFSFVEGHEKEFVLGGLAAAFILLVVISSVVYSEMNEKFMLEMKFNSEKSFNSIYITMVDNPSKAYIEMKNEGVMAVGIYSSNGKLYQGLGDAPQSLSLNKLAQNKRNGIDSTLGIYYYDQESNEIEYFRLSRLNTALETGSYLGNLSRSEIPEIVYVRFDGSQYFRQISRAKLFFIASLLIICSIFILVVNIYIANRHFRIVLSRNENLAQLGAAARTLTHEIKNPLSALTIQTALMKKTLPDSYSADLDVIEHEVKRLTNLTNRVSEFLKNPLGNPTRIELVSFLREIISIFPDKIDFKTDRESVFVEFDSDRARSVFENLIKNATESAENGNPEVEVEIKHLRKNSISISVKDRGDGISPEAKNRLFDPFFSTKIHGSGIGLSISRQFVQARGGQLSVQDRDGGGTVVEIVLPGCEEHK